MIENEVLPSFSNMAIYIEEEYMKHLRPSPGISALPGGRDMYLGYLRYHTTKSGLLPGNVFQYFSALMFALIFRLSEVNNRLNRHSTVSQNDNDSLI